MRRRHVMHRGGGDIASSLTWHSLHRVIANPGIALYGTSLLEATGKCIDLRVGGLRPSAGRSQLLNALTHVEHECHREPIALQYYIASIAHVVRSRICHKFATNCERGEAALIVRHRRPASVACKNTSTPWDSAPASNKFTQCEMHTESRLFCGRWY